VVIRVVTGDECWISFFTMKDKRSNMVWMTDDEPRPEVLKTSFRSRKRMFTIFFNSQGPVAVDIMPDKATITATYYTTSVLPKVLEHIQSTAPTRRRSRIMLHHDNASPHKARFTQTYLDENGIHLMEHPPYSPTWLPATSGSFPKSNQRLLGGLFHGSKT
jgi:histone-lysine N-methyltransferase SETMAR